MRLAEQATGRFPRPLALCPSLYSHRLGGCSLVSDFFILPHTLRWWIWICWLLQPECGWERGRGRKALKWSRRKEITYFKSSITFFFFKYKAICVCGKHCERADTTPFPLLPFSSQLGMVMWHKWGQLGRSLSWGSWERSCFPWDRDWPSWPPFCLNAYMMTGGAVANVKATKKKPCKFQTSVLALFSCWTITVWIFITCSQRQSYLYNVLYTTFM